MKVLDTASNSYVIAGVVPAGYNMLTVGSTEVPIENQAFAVDANLADAPAVLSGAAGTINQPSGTRRALTLLQGTFPHAGAGEIRGKDTASIARARFRVSVAVTDFPTKAAVIVRDDLAVWQRLNVTGFLVSGLIGSAEDRVVATVPGIACAVSASAAASAELT